MSATTVYPTAWLDTTRFGNATRFTYRIPFELRGHLEVGDRVWVADDSVDPFLCRITQLLDGGRSARYEVVEHANA
jgi:hypothetical protein